MVGYCFCTVGRVGSSFGVGIVFTLFTIIAALEENGFGDVTYSAALTRIDEGGDVFWWFYPTTAAAATSKPLLLWLDGVTGLPPSLLANFGMFGPIDFNMNKREDSWVNLSTFFYTV